MMFTCQKCGKPFEAPRERKFCSQQCRSMARVNYYFFDKHGRYHVIPAPPQGWVIGFEGVVWDPNYTDSGFHFSIDEQGKTHVVEVSRHAKRKRMKKLPPSYPE